MNLPAQVEPFPGLGAAPLACLAVAVPWEGIEPLKMFEDGTVTLWRLIGLGGQSRAVRLALGWMAEAFGASSSLD